MSIEKIIALIIVGVVVLVVVVTLAFVGFRFKKRQRKQDYFLEKWKALQSRCAHKEDWPAVLAEADKLLDEALRKRNIKGKTMGARMVKAQKLFSDNDGVWFGHKLRTKYENNPKVSLTKTNMKQALIGLRQGLKDLGVL